MGRQKTSRGEPKIKVVTDGAKRKIIMNPKTKAACTLELHDPHDGGFWLEDMANVLLTYKFGSEGNAVLMRNVVIPQHDIENQLKKGSGGFLNQRPNEPEIRIKAGELLGFDPWHRSRFTEGLLQPILNRLWARKREISSKK